MLNTGTGGSFLAYKYLIKPQHTSLSRQQVHALRSEKSLWCGGKDIIFDKSYGTIYQQSLL